jgi:hypothetical protein
MGFHSRAAAPKPKSTMRNAKLSLEWCKACCHWTLEQWKHVLWRDESCFTIWQSEGLGLADARRTLSTRMRSANCKVWGRKNNGLVLFFMFCVRPLSSNEGKS